MYAFHRNGALRVVTVLFPGSCGTDMGHMKFTGKMAKVLAELKFCRLGKHFL